MVCFKAPLQGFILKSFVHLIAKQLTNQKLFYARFMKNVYLSLLCSLTLVTQVQNHFAQIKIHRSDLSLKGNVRSVSQQVYLPIIEGEKVSAGNKIEFLKSNFIVKYNEKGYKTEEDWLDTTGQVVDRFRYTNLKGLPVQCKWYRMKQNTCKETREISYNKAGFIEEVKWLNQNSKLKKHAIYQYNEKDKLSEMQWIDADRGVLEKWKYSYDVFGNKTQFSTSNASFNYRYNGNNQNSRLIQKDKSGNMVRGEQLKYNQEGLLSTQIGFNKDYKTLYQNSFQYTYDDQGNWTQKIEYRNNKPIRVYKRDITYFPSEPVVVK